MGRGLGCGYKNIVPMDSHIHSLSAKGQKTLVTYKETGDKIGYVTNFNKWLKKHNEQRKKEGEIEEQAHEFELWDIQRLNAKGHNHIFVPDIHKLSAKGSFDAGVVLQQLGGNRFIAMTGAKNFQKDDKKQLLRFNIGRNAKHINWVEIRLNSMDTYDIEFLDVSIKKRKVVDKVDGIYNDQLQDVFTAHTGMYTHL